jgi:hypothetical protein
METVTAQRAIASKSIAIGADSYLALRGSATIGDIVDESVGLALSAVGAAELGRAA